MHLLFGSGFLFFSFLEHDTTIVKVLAITIIFFAIPQRLWWLGRDHLSEPLAFAIAGEIDMWSGLVHRGRWL